MLKIGDHLITLSDLFNALYKSENIELDAAAFQKVEASFNFLKDFSKGKIIYGINTGFGPMAQYKISEEKQVELQYNLIRSHCSGMGNRLPNKYVKALMIARLNTLMRGFSGIHTCVVELLKELINKEIYPHIFEHGGVGASGDLVQLAHLALVLTGEGFVSYKGEDVPTEKAFAQEKLKPITIHLREGLGLMNGTSVMTGVGSINIIESKNLLDWSIFISSVINEIVESYDDHFSLELNQVKLHEGQTAVAAEMQKILSDSKLIRRRAEHLYDKTIEEDYLEHKVQEYYSIRCVPQVLGPIYDTINNAEKVLMNEINSANDNPIIDRENNNVFHGGNFHGDYVALEMDKLKIAITKLSMLCERQLNFLLNDKLNGKLPPFINLGKLGFNFGMQGVQFTATSTTAENQTLSFPMYLHSIPSNNDNQDIVSMGTNAALLSKKVIDNTYQILAIELIAVLQAIDCLGNEKKLSSFSRNIFQNIRKIVPKFESDRPMYKNIQQVIEYIQENRLAVSDTF